MRYSYILFDLDGTVTKSGPGIVNSVRYALKKMGKPELSEETLEKFVGPPLAQSMMRYAGMTEQEAKEAILCYREYYTTKGIYENSVYPGVEEMLKRLKDAGLILALATSKPEVFAGQILDYFHLSPYFSFVCGASLDEKRVEKAEVIAYALQTMGVGEEQKKEVLMVGDRENDILGAKENGLDALGVLYGYGNRKELEEAGACAIAATAGEAAALILQGGRVDIESFIGRYPVCQYAVLKSSEIPFSEKVRHICETECERYGKSWSCPPAVGTVAQCRRRALSYKKALVFTTMAEVTDSSVWTETLATRAQHESVTKALVKELQERGASCLALSAESCQICEACAYPKACRHPEQAIPCVESYGILVTELAEACRIDFFTDMHTVTWFGLIFFSD